MISPRWLKTLCVQGVLTCALAVLSSFAIAANVDPSGSASPQPFSIVWTNDLVQTNQVIVEISGLGKKSLERLRQANWTSQRWQQLLAVYAEQGDVIADIGLPAMMGNYRVTTDALRFEPKFPLDPSVRYRAVFQPSAIPGEKSKSAAVASAFQLPHQKSNPTTVVSQIFPSGKSLPENLLKFYVHFSAPMSRGHIYDHIHLRDETGKEIELPFLEIDEELWDPSMKRLTLFIDPGRIKRGVLPLEEIGPALEQGKRYTLIIDQAWKDSTGQPLKESFQKSFQVGASDREPPDPVQWQIQAPQPGSQNQVVVQFPESMDHALAQRMSHVTGADGQLIAGKTALEEDERRWSFLPDHSWKHGHYQLLIQTIIEDLAGNNIGKPFEVDLFEGVQRKMTNSVVKLSFEVR